MSDKARMFLLAAIAAALALLWWLGGRAPEIAEQRTFRAQILQVDTASLRSFTIIPAPEKHEPPMHFQRGSAGWTVSNDSVKLRAFQRPMNELLAQLADLRPMGVAGSDASTLERYRLVDSLAYQLQLPGTAGGTLRVGSSTTGPDAATAMRWKSDPNVYLVRGSFHAITGMSFTDWIPKPMVNGDPRNWQRITFLFPAGNSYSLERNTQGWTVGGQPADSMKVEKYLHALSRYYGHGLVDPADTLQSVLVYSMRVEDRSRNAPIILGIFNTPNGLIARSTLAPSWIVMPFDPRQDLQRIFRPPEAFLPSR